MHLRSHSFSTTRVVYHLGAGDLAEVSLRKQVVGLEVFLTPTSDKSFVELGGQNISTFCFGLPWRWIPLSARTIRRGSSGFGCLIGDTFKS